MMKLNLTITAVLMLCASLSAREYSLSSPDGSIKVDIELGKTVSYTVSVDGKTVIAPSAIAMDTDNGKWGSDMKLRKIARRSIDEKFGAVMYRRAVETNICNEMTLSGKGFDLVFRAYDDGIAYRFAANGGKPVIVNGETAEFRFPDDFKAYVPYVRKLGNFEQQFFNTFENTYVHDSLSKWEKGSLAFLPLMVEAGDNVKLVITEAELEHYPGMYLYNEGTDAVLKGVFAKYPRKERQGSHNPDVTVGGHNKVVVERENYIARCEAGQAFPWRVIAIARNDVELLDNNLVYKLSRPSVIEDPSWIKPGMVAWEWWNDRNLTGVDFEAGINNETYEYYIDFASKNGVPYVVLDDGWYDAKAGSAFAVVPQIDLPRLIAYADSRNVGLMLWVGYYVFEKEMERVIGEYARMGIKGFKLDAIGRDDQKLNEFYYTAAEIARRHKVVLDFHGGAKPAGLNRTYPNVLNFEGVHGLEQIKNRNYSCDLVKYDLEFPFIRSIAGPLDYTQGAMRNGTKDSFRAIWSEPMSQGTRCRQLAEYIIFDSPLNMLCDSPSNYIREQECTDFITGIPTVWDETEAVEGRIGEYVTLARRDAIGNWYLGGLASWEGREASIKLDFLDDGRYKAVIFKDGANASRNANDYKRIETEVGAGDTLDIKMAPGGGFAVRFIKL